MDLKKFKHDMLKKQAELELAHPSGYLYVTSQYHRERNVAAGTVTEVNIPNAARVLTEGTHQVSTIEEIESYRQKCEENRAQISASLKRNTDRELTITTTRK
jgi:hypothetical protein